MSQSVFPTLITAIFIPSLWQFPSGQFTREYADLHYLKFPVAQGTETFEDLKIVGDRIRLGYNAGLTNQGIATIAIGQSAGESNQSNLGLAIGYEAGQTNQGDGLAIGYNAGQTGQSNEAVAVGDGAGNISQGLRSIAIGYHAGQTNQGASSIAIGEDSTGTGTNSIAIGSQASTAGFNNSVAIGISTTCTANNQLRLGASDVDTVVGRNLAVTGTLTSTDLITANNGLTLGSNKVITLGSGTATPAVGQLGYIYSGAVPGVIALTNGGLQILSTILAVPAGTYMIFGTATYTPSAAIFSTIRGYIQATGSGILGDSITYGRTTGTNANGCINISTCFTSTTAKDYQLGISVAFSGTGATVSTSDTNFVFKMVKIG